MALTKISRGLLDTGVSDSSDSTAITIDSSERVSIGTDTASAQIPLTVYHSDTSQFHIGGAQAGISNNVYFNGSAWANRNSSVGGGIVQIGTGGDFAFRRATSGASPTLTYSAYIDASGNVGINTSSPSSLLHVTHANSTTTPSAIIENTNGAVATNAVILDLKFSGDDIFSNADYIKFQDSSGEEGVITGDGGGRVYYEINSDYRLKENIVDYTGGLNVINALSVKRYNYITRPSTTYTGFLAHEVAEVVDGVARGTKDATETITNAVLNANGKVIAEGISEDDWTAGKTGDDAIYPSDSTWEASHTRPDYQGMDLSKLVPELVSAIQEQQTIIDDLKTRIETLENA